MAGPLSPPIQSPSLTCTSLPEASAALCDPSFPSKYYKKQTNNNINYYAKLIHKLTLQS